VIFLTTALFQGARERDVPEVAHFGPKAQEGGGAKICGERSHDGEVSVAAAICRLPARDLPFASMILGIFRVICWISSYKDMVILV